MANPLPPALSALETRLGLAAGTLDGEDRARAEAALDDAAILILAELPPATAAAWATDAPGVATLVALKAARREFENPRGVNQETLEGHTIGLSESSGVYLTAREISQIRRAAFGRRGGFVGSVRIRTPYETATP